MVNQKKIKLTLLGQGLLAEPIFEVLRKKYTIVEKKSDCLIVANYGRILSEEEIGRPQYGAINIHPSLLPLYRGATPVQSAIANGDKISGYTIIKMDEKVDRGTIIYQEKIKINNDETTEQFIQKVAQKCAMIILKILDQYINHKIKYIPQNDNQATYTRKISTMILIDNIKDQLKIYNLIRAYGTEPGVFIKLSNNQKLKIITTELKNNKLIPLIVQREGKKQISYQEFIKGYRYDLPF